MAQRILYKRTDGKWAWRLRADNGEIIATDGSQGYDNESEARSMADRIIGGEFRNAEKRIVSSNSYENSYSALATLLGTPLRKA